MSPARTRSLVAVILGGAALVATIVVVAIAVWPASETDKAREDGKQLGEAVTSLYNAQTTEEVDAAVTDVRAALRDARDHAADNVRGQIDDQADALYRAADGFVGTHTSDDAFEVDLYQAELNDAVDDLDHQAANFQDEGPEIPQAFWDGYQDGRNA
jgi:hypothetical protein